MRMKQPVAASAFFAYARERHKIYLRRAEGDGEPFTKDPILQQYRFTNVFRELDKTTAWFSRYVRDPMSSELRVVLATVVFRMLNRIECGEAIFCQGDMFDVSAFNEFVHGNGDVRPLKKALLAHVGQRGPYVTGAYIISTPPGYSKLDGALKIMQGFARSSQRKQIENLWGKNPPLETVFKLLREVPYLGKFHSYEIVTDLRHTALCRRSPDVMTWANMGPGARRGLNRIFGRGTERGGRAKWGATIHPDHALEEMRALLQWSRDARLWPQWSKTTGKASGDHGGFHGHNDWPRWELRDVEHTLCEFDKYQRVKSGEGRPRGKFS